MEYPDVKTISSTTSILRIPADNVSEINLSSRALHNCMIEEGVEKYATVVVNEGKIMSLLVLALSSKKSTIFILILLKSCCICIEKLFII